MRNVPHRHSRPSKGGPVIKALTIRQPWASLVALGVKQIETRSWRAPASLIGQHFAVHAGKTLVHDDGQMMPWMWDSFGMWRNGVAGGVDLPLGAIVATARLVDCVPSVDRCSDTLSHVCHSGPGGLLRHVALTSPVYGETEWVISDQLPYGDFTPGRWAWLLDDVKPTTERCPACMGSGKRQPFPGGSACPRCRDWPGQSTGVGTCPPIPAKGRQGLWEWA